jgi:hypothetical protein
LYDFANNLLEAQKIGIELLASVEVDPGANSKYPLFPQVFKQFRPTGRFRIPLAGTRRHRRRQYGSLSMYIVQVFAALVFVTCPNFLLFQPAADPDTSIRPRCYMNQS